MSSTLIVQLDMERFCEEANIPATYVIEIVEHGIIEPQGHAPDAWRFKDYELTIAKRAAKLHQELELEAEVALAWMTARAAALGNQGSRRTAASHRRWVVPRGRG